MNDTSAEVETIFLAMMMARSGAERLAMGAGLFDTARMLLEASLVAEGLDPRSGEFKARVFLRTYGSDFDATTRDRIAARLRARAS